MSSLSASSRRDTISSMTAVWVLNGPNLNLLGVREPETYGTATLADVEKACRAVTDELGWDLDFRQTNAEGELVDWVQQAGAVPRDGELAGVVLNAGAYTHAEQYRAGRHHRRRRRSR